MQCTKCRKKETESGGKRCDACLKYMREYKATHRQKTAAKHAERRCCHSDCLKPAAPNKKSCEKHLERQRSQSTPERRADVMRRYRETKAQVFEAYGGARCACCGDDHLEFLSIDHINGDGAQHRRQMTNGRSRVYGNIYGWLKTNGFPPGFRVLCMNCNFSLGKHGYCPHGDLTQPRVTFQGKPRLPALLSAVSPLDLGAD